jgi:hypothetical protein
MIPDVRIQEYQMSRAFEPGREIQIDFQKSSLFKILKTYEWAWHWWVCCEDPGFAMVVFCLPEPELH